MINYDLVLHSTDTGPDFTTTCRRNSSPVNLSTATGVKFQMIGRDSLTTKVNAAMTVDDGPNGVVSYRWVIDDLDTPGRYWGMVQVTWASGVVETFPDEYVNILVVKGV